MSPHVLIVEDEVYLADALHTALTREGMHAEVLYDGAAAVEKLESSGGGIDVVVLDRDLPGMHGDEICARIVSDYPHIRVLMLTASGTLDDRLSGFNLEQCCPPRTCWSKPGMRMRIRFQTLRA